MVRKLISGLVFLLVLGVVGAGVYYGVTHVSGEPTISAKPDEAIPGARSEAISLPEVRAAGEAVTKIDIGGGRALQMTEAGEWDIMDVQRVTAMLSSLSNPKLSRLGVGSGYELVLTQSGWQMWAIKEYRAQRQVALTQIDIVQDTPWRRPRRIGGYAVLTRLKSGLDCQGCNALIWAMAIGWLSGGMTGRWLWKRQ